METSLIHTQPHGLQQLTTVKIEANAETFTIYSAWNLKKAISSSTLIKKAEIDHKNVICIMKSYNNYCIIKTRFIEDIKIENSSIQSKSINSLRTE